LFSYKKSYRRFTGLTNETSFFILLKIQIHSITIASCENDFPIALTVRGGFSLSTLFQLCTKFVLPSTSERNFLHFTIKQDFPFFIKIVELAFLTPNSEAWFSNIFIFGISKNTEAVANYKVPRLMSSLTPKQLITQIAKPTFDDVINLEMARIHYHIDRLEFAFLVAASNFDPKTLMLIFLLLI
jgi:hypothetical protein